MLKSFSMDDEKIAKTKTSMKITDNQSVSWKTVKGTILNYIRHHIASAIPNAKKILSEIENKYSLSGQNQSDLFKYKNSVSGLINKITGKSQDWPSSSVFSYRKGNRVILITLAGIIEYDVTDIKETPDGNVYITPSKAHLFNGSEIELTICPVIQKDQQILSGKDLEERNFTCKDIGFFPAVPQHTKINDIDDIKELTTYEITNKDINNGNKCYLSINSKDGISISNLEDGNLFHGSLTYNNENKINNENIEICDGDFANFMPYGNIRVGYREIDGSKNNQLFEADGCGGWYNDNLSSVNMNYIVNDFINTMANADAINEDRISEVSDQLRLLLCTYNKTNIGENEYDNETGERYFTINTLSAKDGYYHTQTLFNGKHIDQIINFDEDGNYLIAHKNLKRNASNDVYEVQLSNGNLFVGTLKFSDETGNVYFMDGKFLNRDGQVVDNKKQISLQEASSLLFSSGRNVNEDDLRDFELSDRFIIEKGENGYNFTTVGTSFENTVKNDKISKDYLPSLEYIDRQIFDVEEFIKGEMQLLNNQPQYPYDKFIKQIKTKGFSKTLIKAIRKATKELYRQTKENTYVLNDGEKLTKERLSAFYSQLSQWQYLYNMRCKKYELDGKDNTREKENITDDSTNVETQAKNVETEAKNENDTKKAEDQRNDKQEEDKISNNSVKDENEENDSKLKSENNLLNQQSNDAKINHERYPKILNNNDLRAILKDPEAEQLASESVENNAIFSNIMKNVVNTEDDKINLFLKTCKLLHESRGGICEDGKKILILSQEEYENFMKLNNRLTYSMLEARNKELYNTAQSYHIEITSGHNDIKEDFNKAMQFALSGEEQLNMALHAKNCQLFDVLDKNGEIKRCCNDILYERDINGESLSNKYSGYYNEYEDKNSLNTNSNLSINSLSGEEMNSSII